MCSGTWSRRSLTYVDDQRKIKVELFIHILVNNKDQFDPNILVNKDIHKTESALVFTEQARSSSLDYGSQPFRLYKT